MTNPVGSTAKSHPDGSDDLTFEGNADTSAVAGASGSDITASTDYGSKKSANGANDVRLQTFHGSHRHVM